MYPNIKPRPFNHYLRARVQTDSSMIGIIHVANRPINHDIDAWARHAAAANGFGDVFTDRELSHGQPA